MTTLPRVCRSGCAVARAQRSLALSGETRAFSSGGGVAKSSGGEATSSGAVHAVAAAGFSDAANYNVVRPSYPLEAVLAALEPALGKSSGARVALKGSEGLRVLDLAAGTGKLTAQLLTQPCLRGRVAEVVACEPVAGMRLELCKTLRECGLVPQRAGGIDSKSACNSHAAAVDQAGGSHWAASVFGAPTAAVVDGTSTRIPFPEGAFDAVIVAQAFHWFDNKESVAEIHRVLASGGVFVAMWNIEDRTVPWIKALRQAYEPYDEGLPQYRKREWAEVMAGMAPELFPKVDSQFFHHDQVLESVDQVWLKVKSKSYINSISAQTQLTVKSAVEDVVKHYGVDQMDTLAVPYNTQVVRCVKP